jgi:WD40 repeat protein
MTASLQVTIGGLAADWQARDDGYVVKTALGGDASDGELRHGDRVVGIAVADGKLVPTTGMALAQFLEHARGPVDSTVDVTVVSGTEPEPKLRTLHRRALSRPAVVRLAFSSDGSRLVAVTDLGTVTAWDITTRDVAYTLHGMFGPVAFSPDSRRLVLVASEGSLLIVRSDNGEKVCTIPGFHGNVSGATFREDSSLVAAVTSGPELIVYVWKAGP